MFEKEYIQVAGDDVTMFVQRFKDVVAMADVIQEGINSVVQDELDVSQLGKQAGDMLPDQFTPFVLKQTLCGIAALLNDALFIECEHYGYIRLVHSCIPRYIYFAVNLYTH